MFACLFVCLFVCKAVKKTQLMSQNTAHINERVCVCDAFCWFLYLRLAKLEAKPLSSPFFPLFLVVSSSFHIHFMLGYAVGLSVY